MRSHRAPRCERPLRVVIADDHQLIRDGLSLLFQTHHDFDLVGQASTVADVVRRVALAEPDVAIVDLYLPDGSGLDACHRIHAVSPKTDVAILTAFPDGESMRESRKAGAAGFLLKRMPDEELIEAIREIADHRRPFGCPNKDQLIESELARLTSRELDVLKLISAGRTNHEIADALGLAHKTVKNYVSTILTKLGTPNRASAAVCFVSNRANPEVRARSRL